MRVRQALAVASALAVLVACDASPGVSVPGPSIDLPPIFRVSFPPAPEPEIPRQYPLDVGKYNFNQVETHTVPATCTRTLQGCGASPMFDIRTRTVTYYFVRYQPCEGCGYQDRPVSVSEWTSANVPVISPP